MDMLSKCTVISVVRVDRWMCVGLLCTEQVRLYDVPWYMYIIAVCLLCYSIEVRHTLILSLMA